MKKQTTFIISIIVVILLVLGLGAFMNNQSKKPSKYDAFAQALKAEGANFYGAFWCPHCKAQKEEFGNAKQYLPYVECSNPDQSMTQACKDAKVESYPSWTFKDGISVTSAQEPSVCEIRGTKGESSLCAQTASRYFRTWTFPGYRFSIKSPADPVRTGDVWKFPQGAMTQGEIPMEFLAQQINFTLPE